MTSPGRPVGVRLCGLSTPRLHLSLRARPWLQALPSQVSKVDLVRPPAGSDIRALGSAEPCQEAVHPGVHRRRATLLQVHVFPAAE